MQIFYFCFGVSVEKIPRFRWSGFGMKSCFGHTHHKGPIFSTIDNFWLHFAVISGPNAASTLSYWGPIAARPDPCNIWSRASWCQKVLLTAFCSAKCRSYSTFIICAKLGLPWVLCRIIRCFWIITAHLCRNIWLGAYIFRSLLTTPYSFILLKNLWWKSIALQLKFGKCPHAICANWPEILLLWVDFLIRWFMVYFYRFTSQFVIDSRFNFSTSEVNCRFVNIFL